MGAMDDVFSAISDGDAARLAASLRADPRRADARDAHGVSAVMFALYRGRRDLADLVLGAGREPDLFEAAALGRTDRVAALHEAEAFSADGFTPLHLACFFGRAETAALLLDRGDPVDVVARNDSRVRPLHSALAGRDEPTVRLLLARGAEVDAAQRGGWTALHAAAKHGLALLVAALLERGADPDRPADDGSTPRDLARQSGHAALLP